MGYNINDSYVGAFPMYREGHLKAFQQAGYYSNFRRASVRIDNSGIPAIRTPYLLGNSGGDTVKLYKIEGAIESAETYADLILLRNEVVSFVAPTITDTKVEEDVYYFSTPFKSFLLDNDSVYEVVLSLDDNVTKYESELLITGCPVSNGQIVRKLKTTTQTFYASTKAAGESETFTLYNQIAESTKVLCFVNGQQILPTSQNGNQVTIQYPFSTNSTYQVIIYYSYA